MSPSRKPIRAQPPRPVAGPATGAGYSQAAAAVAYRGAIGRANVCLVPTNKIAVAGCATLPRCTATTDWNGVSWNTGWEIVSTD